MELEICNRDNSLVVGQLLEENPQCGKRAGYTDLDFLSAVVLFLNIILRREFPKYQTI
jgi:hypothetical protein